MIQEVLQICTEKNSLRTKIIGWTHENPALYVKNKHISNTPSPIVQANYTTVFEALADGWQMLSPPKQYKIRCDEGMNRVEYEWWLVRNSGQSI